MHINATQHATTNRATVRHATQHLTATGFNQPRHFTAAGTIRSTPTSELLTYLVLTRPAETKPALRGTDLPVYFQTIFVTSKRP